MKLPNHTDRLEDLHWFAMTGENAEGAAMRLGISVAALERWCARNGAGDLWSRLVARNPQEHAPAANQWTRSMR